ncbi:hypothetical protein HMPREF1986_00304 [Oribacterium sp. oral taxon 078 str. F0263]|nr:hypothetical protein HMPREF1986_00304 [Oribacterium sp. oral taxon 078 str. F0263]
MKAETERRQGRISARPAFPDFSEAGRRGHGSAAFSKEAEG